MLTASDITPMQGTVVSSDPAVHVAVTSVPTVVASDSGGTYNGSPYAAIASVNGNSSVESVTPTVTYYTGTATTGAGTSTAPSIAGTYTVVASFAGSSDFSSALSSPVTFSITKAAPSVTATETSGQYTGSAFTAATASIESVTPTLAYYSGTLATGTALSGAPTTVGTYTVLASFAGSTDYASGNASTTFTISKAAPAVTVNDAGGTYTGSTFAATTASIEAVIPSLLYYSGASASGTALSGAPSAAGTYTVLASFAGSTDYASGTASTTFTINKATTSISVTDSSGNFDNAAFNATTASVESVSPTLIYYSGTNATGAALSGAPSAVGTYTVLASFAGSTDYASGTASTTFTISKATPSVNVTATSGTYNGGTFTASETLAGTNQSAVSSLEGITPTLTYHFGPSSAGTTLSGPPTTVGTYTALVSFAGSADYNGALGSATFSISKATSPTVTVTDAGGVYNSAAFSGSATVGGSASLENVAPSLIYYAGTSATGSPLSGAPTTVGTYTVLASFAGSADYLSGLGSSTFTITKAAPSLTVTDAGGAYNSAAFGAIEAVAGVGGQSTGGASLEGVTPSLTYYSGTSAIGTALGGAPTTVGTYTVLASFAGSTDYVSTHASTTFTISPNTTPPALTIVGGTATYVRGGTAINLAPAATLSTGDGAFANASLAVTDTTESTYPTDLLGIGSSGSLVVSGTSLIYAGTTIGTFTGGGASPLAISFNASATQAGIVSVIEHITFNSSTATPTLANRTITLQLTDGLANVGTAVTQTVNVSTPPLLTIGGPAVYYTRGKAAVPIAPNASISTGDGLFAYATLGVVDNSLTRYSNDRLQIASSGSLVVSGTSLIYGGTTIGFYTGGGGVPLGIHFNASATQAEITSVVQNVTFSSANPYATLSNRSITFYLTDGLGYSGGNVLQSVTVATTPVLSIATPTVTYHRGSAPIALAPSVGLTTGNNAFPNSSLLITDTNQSTYPNDRLGIRSAGSLVVSGTSLIYAGTTIGSFTGGGASPLSIKFNASASQAAVLAVAQNVTFANANPSPTLAHRIITLQLTDGAGNAGTPVLQTVAVSN